MSAYDAVLFIGFGGPEKQDDVIPFLEIVTKGRGIPKERLADVAHHYEVIGGRSPINELTRRQAQALEHQLRARGSELRVYVGQRNWHPFLEDTLRKMAADGVKRAAGFVAAAHRCEASWERYLNAVETARQNIGPQAPTIDYVSSWFDHPLFIEAICERIKEILPSPFPLPEGRGPTAGKGVGLLPLGEGSRRPDEGMPWFFTAHSIPTPMAEKSQYVQELTRTAELVAQKFGKKDWALAYSSRSGRPQDPWLEPDVCDVIRNEASRGTKEILFIPIGFIADHVEILFDLDVEAQQAAQESGVKLYRAKTVGDHPLFVKMMADSLLLLALPPCKI